jgi:hypothetical protein
VKLEISRTLTLSTAHVTSEDSRLLDDCTHADGSHMVNGKVSDPVVGWDKDPYGWFVWVPDLDDETMLCIREFGYSPEFLNILIMAAERDVTWICFDSDGPRVEGLPTFER